MIVRQNEYGGILSNGILENPPNSHHGRVQAPLVNHFRSQDFTACVTGGGSMVRVHMKADIPSTYRTAYMTAKESKIIQASFDHLFDPVAGPTGCILVKDQ